MLGEVDAQRRKIGPARHPALADVEIQRLARRGERREAADRRRVVHDAAKDVGETEHSAQPAQRDVLEFGCGRRRAPKHGVHVERAASASARIVIGAALIAKYAKKRGWFPMRDPRNDDSLEVPQDGLERLRFVGRLRGERRDDIARCDARQHRVAPRFAQVVVDPGGDARELFAKRRVRNDVSQVGHDGDDSGGKRGGASRGPKSAA